MATFLRRYIYLDSDGVLDLCSQAEGGNVTEQSITDTQSSTLSRDGSISSDLRLFRAKGTRATADATQQQRVQTSIATPSSLILKLEEILASSESLHHIKRLSDIAQLRANPNSSFVTGILPFRLQQTHAADPIEDVKAKAMLELKVATDEFDSENPLLINCCFAVRAFESLSNIPITVYIMG